MLRINTDLTTDTIRISAPTTAGFAAAIGQLVWPESDVFWRPRASVLLPLGSWRDAVAGVPILHFPANSVLLATSTRQLSSAARTELLRLKPTGIGTDGKRLPAQVFLIGDIGSAVRQSVRNLGFTAIRMRGTNSAATAAEVARHMAEDMPNPPIILVPYNSEIDSQPAVALAAHSGAPILFVNSDSVPDATRDALVAINPRGIFILGRNSQISSTLVNQVQALRPGTIVRRVGGETATAYSINVAKFFDVPSNFGWGRTERNGAFFSFVKAGNIYQSIFTATLAHLANHAPELILPADNTVPEVLEDYLRSVNPPLFEPPMPPFMKGWIIGDRSDITVRQQTILESLLIKEQGNWPPM